MTTSSCPSSGYASGLSAKSHNVGFTLSGAKLDPLIWIPTNSISYHLVTGVYHLILSLNKSLIRLSIARATASKKVSKKAGGAKRTATKSIKKRAPKAAAGGAKKASKGGKKSHAKKSHKKAAARK